MGSVGTPRRDQAADDSAAEPSVGVATRLGRLGWVRIAVSLALLAAVLWPLVAQKDSFPFSNYPMFSFPRDRDSTVNVAIGFGADGQPVTLSPESIAGSDQVIHAARAVGDAVRSDAAPALCEEIARRVAAGSTPAASIEIVTETFDVVDWFDGDTEPDQRVVHARCEVRR